jgi:uncharacterized protein (TIGR02145 family)
LKQAVVKGEAFSDDRGWFYSGVGRKLKSKSGWNHWKDGGSDNGTDVFGFSALPGGFRFCLGDFYGAGNSGYWWTATEFSDRNAYCRYMRYNNIIVDEYDDDKSNGRSVRCVQE